MQHAYIVSSLFRFSLHFSLELLSREISSHPAQQRPAATVEAGIQHLSLVVRARLEKAKYAAAQVLLVLFVPTVFQRKVNRIAKKVYTVVTHSTPVHGMRHFLENP